MIRVLCIIISLSFIFNSSISDENQQMIEQILGETDKPTIDFSLLTPEDSLITLSGLRDKVVFVNFWATWCGPCRMEIPELNEMQKKYEKDDFIILGISITDTEKALLDFVKLYNIDYPLLFGSPESIEKILIEYGGVYSVPTSILINKKGEAIFNYPGAILKSYDMYDGVYSTLNDKIVKGERSIYVMETVVKIAKESGLKLYDRYIWYKKNGLPMGGNKRLNDRMEYIFHFVKDVKNFKTNIDAVRVPYAPSSVIRAKAPVKTQKSATESGIAEFGKDKPMNLNPLGSKPNGVFRFDNAGVLKGAKHPAPFHPDLPAWFIKYLTDREDIVLDPFMGGGTTAEVALNLGRKYIGFEKNKVYIDKLVTPKLKKFKSEFWE